MKVRIIEAVSTIIVSRVSTATGSLCAACAEANAGGHWQGAQQSRRASGAKPGWEAVLRARCGVARRSSGITTVRSERLAAHPAKRASRPRVLLRPLLLTAAILLAAGMASAEDAGVAWDDLDEQQQRVLNGFAGSWDSLAADRQTRLSVGADRWVHMTPDQRNAAQTRFSHWRDIQPERRALIRDRYKQYRGMSPADQKRVRDNFRRFNRMPTERRKMLRDRYRNMTPDQRKRLRDRVGDKPRPATRG